METGVFDYRDYKTYLVAWIREHGRGEKSRIAEALRCHGAYVSQVLHGNADLSLEQADALNTYCNHSEAEAEFFLLLVGHARAGTTNLKRRYASKIEKALELKNRIEFKKELSGEHQQTYYSSWHYAAVHVLLSIPGVDTKEAIAERLRLPSSKIGEVLEFLEKSGLVQRVQGRYRAGGVSVHLPLESAMVARHHVNWRLQAIQALDRKAASHMHYSSVVSIAEKDAYAIRDLLHKAIEQVRGVVKASPEERVFCYSMDLFEL